MQIKMTPFDFMTQTLAKLLLPNQSPIYSLSSQSSFQGPDESAIETYIYESNTENRDEYEDEFDALDEELLEAISAYDPSPGAHYTWTRKDDTGTITQWESPNDDYIRIQFTDHLIYLVIIQSGQY